MATTFRTKINYPLGSGTLNTAIDDNDLSIVLQSGQGTAFPSATFTVSIDEEIILIDSRSSDTLTVNASGRGYDSSTASAHAAGVDVKNLQIVKDFTDLETAVNALENGTFGNAITPTVSDSGTNTVVTALTLKHLTSGTAAAGFGVKAVFAGEDASGNAETLGEIQSLWTTATHTSEESKMLFNLMEAGSLVTAATLDMSGWNSGVLGRAFTIDGPVNPGILVDANAGTDTAAKIILNINNDNSWGKIQWRVDNTKYFEWAMQGNALTNLGLYYTDADTLCANFTSTGGLNLVGALTGTGVTTTNTGITTGLIARRSDNTAAARSGSLLFQGVNSTPGYVTYGAIYGQSVTLTATAEDGGLLFYTMKAGTLTLGATLDQNAGLTLVGALTVGGNTTLGNADTDLITMRGKPRIQDTASPASNATGTAGMITWDTSYIYVCTATDTWKRAALTGGY